MHHLLRVIVAVHIILDLQRFCHYCNAMKFGTLGVMQGAFVLLVWSALACLLLCHWHQNAQQRYPHPVREGLGLDNNFGPALKAQLERIPRLSFNKLNNSCAAHIGVINEYRISIVL
jgi:hypothetical protein